ncbi:MMPL family transporter [Natronolimnohabitans sp. A-GB9]|uniref:efflux RND transporter permease subunit n=1 Tax=Natronolimnohabitans sp. A-GB9 TaxID=3069757 RepID=UPI0027B34B0E|nr:MMPL family transporter [Natronolimnohabitans sp. A-GB9]MDQ2051195.1 MMPL family transporter [Natronolimnohabitans sp. A-GB9]
MSGPHHVAAWIVDHAALVLVVGLLLTALFGVGLTDLESDSSLEQFESESPEHEALTSASERFSDESAANETSVQIAVHGDDADVLSRESLIATLELQAAIREDERVAPTLVDEEPTVGLANVVATSIIHQDDVDALEQRAEELRQREQRLDETTAELRTGLEEVRALQREYDQLNDSYEAGEIDEQRYQNRSSELEGEIDAIVERATADLDSSETDRFERAVETVRSTQRELSTLERDEFDSEAAYQRHRDRLEDDLSAAYTDGTVGVLRGEYEQLNAAHDELVAERKALETASQPPLTDQIDTLETVNESVYDETLERLLESDSDDPFGGLAVEFLPADVEPGSEPVETHLLVVTQELDTGEDETGLDAIDDEHVEGQRAIASVASEYGTASDREYAVFGFGLLVDEIDRSLGDSLAIVGPIAVAFVVVTLSIAYRDPLDIALGLVGVLAVVIWTLGFMGWAGIAINQALVAVPVLLVGLSIDYAVHVIMRHREHRSGSGERATMGDDDGSGVRGAMVVALAGVGVALTWATVTTAIGFLSNLVSPVAPIREFGLVSTVGILAAFVVFGAVIPAAKVALETRLERRGRDRRKRAFGTGRRLGTVLSLGSRAAQAAPVAVLVCALLFTGAGAYGATTVDTTLEEADFLVEEPPDWTDDLPGEMASGEYRVTHDLTYIDSQFQRETPQAQVLVDGDVTDPETLRRLETAQETAGGMETAAGGDDAVRSPLTLMESVAAENESFNASFQVADRNDDGVPDRNVALLYDRLFEIDPDAASTVLARGDDGEYEAVRLLVDVRSDADGELVTSETRAVAAAIDSDDAADEPETDLSAIATGDPVVTHVLERDVTTSMLESLVLTIVVVAGVLAVAYRLSGAGAAFGVVTVLPVALTVPWVLGTMALFDVPLNALTGTVASLTIGLGVAYCIHVSSRYRLELQRGNSVSDALTTTVRGTGGAVLGSAATTIGGVATLLIALVPVLRQFGAVTGLLIAYAFVASVVLLPALLVLWTRLFGPVDATADHAENDIDSGDTSDDDPADDGDVTADVEASEDVTVAADSSDRTGR